MKVAALISRDEIKSQLDARRAFLLIDVLTCVIAFALERDEDWSLLVPVLLQRFYYRQLMYVVLFRSVKEAVSGRPVGWHGVGTEAPAPQQPRTVPAES